MHAMVVSVDIDASRGDDVTKLLDEFTIPAAKSQEGFVRGTWLRSGDGSSGIGVVVFGTEAEANAAADNVRQGGPPPEGPVTLRDIAVHEVVREA